MQGETYHGTVDGQNPAPPRMMIIPSFIVFLLHPRWVGLEIPLGPDLGQLSGPRELRQNLLLPPGVETNSPVFLLSSQFGHMPKNVAASEYDVAPPTFVGTFRRSYGVNTSDLTRYLCVCSIS